MEESFRSSLSTVLLLSEREKEKERERERERESVVYHWCMYWAVLSGLRSCSMVMSGFNDYPLHSSHV